MSLPPYTERGTSPPAEALPSVDSLPAPKVLLASSAPYLMTVCVSTAEIRIDASHYKSLKLLCEYFYKHTQVVGGTSGKRVTRYDFFNAHFLSRDFIASSMHETLLIRRSDAKTSGSDAVPLSPILILAFIENVLGYTRIHEDAVSWSFRRNKAFAEESQGV